MRGGIGKWPDGQDTLIQLFLLLDTAILPRNAEAVNLWPVAMMAAAAHTWGGRVMAAPIERFARPPVAVKVGGADSALTSEPAMIARPTCVFDAGFACGSPRETRSWIYQARPALLAGFNGDDGYPPSTTVMLPAMRYCSPRRACICAACASTSGRISAGQSASSSRHSVRYDW